MKHTLLQQVLHVRVMALNDSLDMYAQITCKRYSLKQLDYEPEISIMQNQEQSNCCSINVI